MYPDPIIVEIRVDLSLMKHNISQAPNLVEVTSTFLTDGHTLLYIGIHIDYFTAQGYVRSRDPVCRIGCSFSHQPQDDRVHLLEHEAGAIAFSLRRAKVLDFDYYLSMTSLKLA